MFLLLVTHHTRDIPFSDDECVVLPAIFLLARGPCTSCADYLRILGLGKLRNQRWLVRLQSPESYYDTS